MKRIGLLLATLFALLSTGSSWAGTTTETFDNRVTFSNGTISLAGWSRIAPSYYVEDEWEDFYMSYSYYTEGGVDGSGAIFSSKQQAGTTYDNKRVSDYLVTPVLKKGTVSLQVKGSILATSSWPTYVRLYTCSEDGKTVGSELTTTTSADINNDTYVTLSATLDADTRVAIRMQYAFIDNLVNTYEDALQEAYHWDFNEKVTTPSRSTDSPEFAAASGWTRFAQGGEGDGWGPYYMQYYWKATDGVDGTGCMQAYKQEAGSMADGGPDAVKDYLVTPKISGKLTVAVKAVNGYLSSAYLRLYKADLDTKKVGDELTPTVSGQLSGTDWVTYTVDLTEETAVAFRMQYVYIDDVIVYSAQEAEKYPGLTITGVDPHQDTGVLYVNSEADGYFPITAKVAIKNTGEKDLKVGDENYSISILQEEKVVATVPIDVDLAIGEEDTVTVTARLPYKDNTLVYNYYVLENVTGSREKIAYIKANEYVAKLELWESGSYSSVGTNYEINFGTTNKEKSFSYALKSVGAAPVEGTVSVTGGFELNTSTLSLNSGEVDTLVITLPAKEGVYEGELTFTYGDNTLTYPVKGRQVNAEKWFASFDGGQLPEGTSAGESVTVDESTSYVTGTEYFAVGSVADAGDATRFVSPQLTALKAGEEVSFDVAKKSNNSFVTFQISTDSINWTDVKTVSASDMSDTQVSSYGSAEYAFTTVTATVPAAGKYYLGFIVGYAYLDNVVGLYEKSVDATIDATGYTTLYYSDTNLKIPEGVTATTYSAVSGNTMTVSKTYASGDVIPAGEAVVLKGTADTTVSFAAVDSTVNTVDDANLLKGTDVETVVNAPGYKYYVLGLPEGSTDVNQVAFYYQVENGTSVTNPAHKAYLAVDEASAADFFAFAGNETGIHGITADENLQKSGVYTVSGVRVNGNNLRKGIYIVNGKKVVIK